MISQTDLQTDRLIDIQTDLQTDRLIDIQTDLQTDFPGSCLATIYRQSIINITSVYYLTLELKVKVILYNCHYLTIIQ